MSVKTHLRLDIARQQLETAVKMFVSGADRFSVITLAGASDVILSQLAIRKNNENFTDTLKREEKDENTRNLTREKYGTQINDILFINDLKHLDPGEDGFITLNVEQCALASILKAVVNFTDLGFGNELFVQAFLLWVRQNLDPEIYNIYMDPSWKPSSEAEAIVAIKPSLN